MQTYVNDDSLLEGEPLQQRSNLVKNNLPKLIFFLCTIIITLILISLIIITEIQREDRKNIVGNQKEIKELAQKILILVDVPKPPPE